MAVPNISERLIYPLQVLISLLDEITPQKERCSGAFSITYSWRRLCLFPDLFTPNLQTTMLHTADAGGVLEADLDTFTPEKSHAATTETGEKERTEKT